MSMRQILVGASMVFTAAVLSPAVLAQSKTMDEIKAALKPGEFVLTGSEVKTLHSSKDEAREYRVCVKAQKETAPMKVMADDMQETVQPGECKNVSGKRIVATPAEPLSGSAHIVGTYHHEKETRLSEK